MKKLLAILVAPFCLMAAVSYDTESELQKIYSETQETNKRIESVKEEITGEAYLSFKF